MRVRVIRMFIPAAGLLWLTGCHDVAGSVLDTVGLAFQIARVWF